MVGMEIAYFEYWFFWLWSLG